MKSTLFSLLLLQVVIQQSSAVVTIENNGYKGLIIAIHKNVPDNPELLARIKNMLTSASSHLHRVTKKRAFFEEVTVVVPSTWSLQQDDYEIVQGGDRFSQAEVRVDVANPSFGDAPYTLQPGECGEPGEYIHLTPEFLLSEPQAYVQADEPSTVIEGDGGGSFGSAGRVFVHEWSHLRYGTFDEHGLQGDQQTPAFYVNDQGMIQPTSCADNIRGWLRDLAGEPCVLDVDGMPDEKCVFYPDTDRNGTTKEGRASVMYMPALESADGFCDDESEDLKHNAFAPNKHNVMCQGRSTWDVVMKHADFFADRNPPRDLVSSIPKFRVIQPKTNQRLAFVLVLDVSGSMLGRRIDLLRAATSRFIRYQLSDFCTVGMVSFSTNSSVLANMTAMDDQARQRLLSHVPAQADTGFTAIGKGIRQALQLLRDSREPTEGTLLLLVSDGEENVEPYVGDVLEDIQVARVIINTVAFGRHASKKLEKLVQMTGGKGFFYDDEKVSHKVLDSAFIESAATQADVELQPVEIASRHVALKPNEAHEGFFLVDRDLGRSTEFIVTYDYPVDPADGSPLQVLLWSPRGKKYDSHSAQYKEDRHTLSISFSLPQAEPGKWKYWIQNMHSSSMDVSFVVSSEASQLSEQPIRVRSWISDVDVTFPSRVKVYAEVKKGYNPIVDASVVATIDRPQGDPWLMVLFDNGAGADTTANDGIYSGYFAHFNGSGRYSVEAVVVNDGRARVSVGAVPGAASRAPHLPVLPRGKRVDLGVPQREFAVQELRPAKTSAAYVTNDVQEKGGDSPVVVLKPVDDFERFTSAGSFRLEEWLDKDVVAPSRVTDLKIVDARLFERTVYLEWTSPGDDLDDGQATLTEVRYHHDPLHLLQNFLRSSPVTTGMLVEGDFRPPAPHDRHVMVLRLPPESELMLNVSNNRIYFAVRTRDEIGNVGDVSNLGLAHFRDPLPAVHVYRMDPSDLEDILWTVLVVVFALIVVVLFSLLVCRLRSRQQKHKYECSTSRTTRATPAERHNSDKLLV